MKLHDTNKEIFDENFGYLDENIEFLLRKIERKQSVSLLDRIRNLCLYYVYYACPQASHIKTNSDENIEEIEPIYRNLYLFVQNSINLFTLSKSKQDYVPLSVDDMEIEFVTDGYQGYVGVKHWTDTFFASLISREPNALKVLELVSKEDFEKQGYLKAEDFLFSYVDFLKSLGSPDEKEKLEQVKEDLKRTTIAKQENLDCLIQPQLDLWQKVLENDSTSFNQVLEESVKKYNAYWSQKKDDWGGNSYRCNLSNGFVALNLTGICAYAYDKGIEISYESDYLPKFFIEGYMKIDAKVVFPD